MHKQLRDLDYFVPDDVVCAPVDYEVVVCRRQLDDDAEALWAAEQTDQPLLVKGDQLYTVHGLSADEAAPLLERLMR